jgi:hypothetical protein
MDRHMKSLVAAIMLCVVTSGCASGDHEPAHVETAGSIQVVIDSTPPRDMGGFGFGPAKVVTLADSCLGVQIENVEYLVAWPAGSTVEGKSNEVTVTTPEEATRLANGDTKVSHESVTVRIGNTVHGGTPGYSGNLPPLAEDFDWADDLNPACRGFPVWQAVEVALGGLTRR